MKLVDVLEIVPGDVVAFVGAGGKTSAMFRLAAELVEQGLRVVTTTTTRVSHDEMLQAPVCLALEHDIQLLNGLPEQLERHRHIFVYSTHEPGDKVRGIRPSWIDEKLAPMPDIDVLLIEADGSRRLPMKAPLLHEPVVPSCTTMIVPVVGLIALGQPLDEDHIYGANVICSMTGCTPGEPVTPYLIASVLLSPQLGLKGAPPGARIIPLLNQITPEQVHAARQIASLALTDLHIERVLIGAVREENPVSEIRRRIGAIILAAGQSRRMGKPKLLLPWGKGTIIRTVCEQLAACDAYELIVIAGELQDAIEEQVAGLHLRVIHNPDYAQGEMLSSVQVGVRALIQTCEACLIALGDQPMLEQPVVQAIIDAYAQGKGRIIAPSYNKRRGHPILVDRAYWQGILDLPPGGAPRDLLRANENAIYHLSVGTPSILRDIDTPEDYHRALERNVPKNSG